MKRYLFRKLRSAHFVADVSIDTLPMQNCHANQVGSRVNGFASSRG
jgi:hypothetical protein